MLAAYVFDAYGTLFDVHSAVRRHVEVIGHERGGRLSELWRQKQLEYSWVRALAGRYQDFAAITSEALDFAVASVAPECAALTPSLMEAYHRLDAYPEVPAVLGNLKARGARIAILSNGTPAMLAAAIEAAGIASLIDVTLSVASVPTYKTDPRVYQLAVDALEVGAKEISFQSSNRWDIAGAVAFGLRSVWINRAGHPDEYPDLAPVTVLPSLTELLDLA
jgi:2-haloacid dehalogenase